MQNENWIEIIPQMQNVTVMCNYFHARGLQNNGDKKERRRKKEEQKKEKEEEKRGKNALINYITSLYQSTVWYRCSANLFSRM